MADLSLRDVHKVYADGLHAVRDVSLEIPDGELVVFVGPSGCGKTTLLRMIAGLEEVTEGVIELGGKVINDVDPRERDIAMVFQNYALYPHMSVHDNIAFPLKLKKIAREERDRRVLQVAQTLGLGDQLKRKPRQLSGGQRQRVAMGRAIVREPQVFLMDEPLSNLDAKLRVQMRAEISRLQRELGVTTVYVTHDQVEAMTLGDRVAVLRGGVLQQYGHAEEIYRRPLNLFVAGFIGSPSMNFVEAVLSDDCSSVSIGGRDLRLSDGERNDDRLRGYAGRQVVVGIRPERLEDAAVERTAPVSRRLVGEVIVREGLGSDVLVHFSLRSTRALARTVARHTHDVEDPVELEDLVGDEDRTLALGRFDPSSRVRVGESIEVAVRPDSLHFFDPESGSAIAAYAPAGTEPNAVSGQVGVTA